MKDSPKVIYTADNQPATPAWQHFNHTGKKIESVSEHPNGKYTAQAGHDPYIHICPVADLFRFGNDAIPVAHKACAADHAEYLDFNADGSFLVSAHQSGLFKLWVWMGEESDLNASRYHQLLQQQSEGKQ